MDNNLCIDDKVFDKIIRYKLKNGLKINIFQKKNLNKKIFMLIVNSGGYYNKISGLAHLMEHYISHSFQNINKENNININYFLTKINTENLLTRYLYCYDNNDFKNIKFKDILELFCKTINIKELDEKIIDIEKERIDIEFNLTFLNNSMILLEEQFIDEYNFKNGCGNKQTFNIKNLKQELTDYYNFFYNSNNMELFIIDNEPLNIIKQYIKCFEQIKPFNKDLNKNSKFYINLYNKSFYNYSSIFKNNIFKINVKNLNDINLIYSINNKYLFI